MFFVFVFFYVRIQAAIQFARPAQSLERCKNTSISTETLERTELSGDQLEKNQLATASNGLATVRCGTRHQRVRASGRDAAMTCESSPAGGAAFWRPAQGGGGMIAVCGCVLAPPPARRRRARIARELSTSRTLVAQRRENKIRTKGQRVVLPCFTFASPTRTGQSPGADEEKALRATRALERVVIYYKSP